MEVVPRKLPSQARSRATVDAILGGAARLLTRSNKLSTNVIARVAGVSIGTLYQYFPNKDAIVASLMKRYIDITLDTFDAAAKATEGQDLESAIRHGVGQLTDMPAKNPMLHRAFVLTVLRLGHEHLIPLENGLVSRLHTFLQGHAHRIDHTDLERTAFFLVTAVHSIMHITLLRDPKRMQHPSMPEELSNLILGYLLRSNSTTAVPDPMAPVEVANVDTTGIESA